MDDPNAIQSRLAALESQLPQLDARLSQLEERLEALAAHVAEQKSLRRYVETKTGRSGEMSTRIAQRLAKCEAAIELLARVDHEETADQA